MGNIIKFHDNPVTNIRKDLIEKERELKELKKELVFFKKIYLSTDSTGELLKLQIADMESTVTILQGHLEMIQKNLKNLKRRLSNLDEAKSQVEIINPEDKPK